MIKLKNLINKYNKQSLIELYYRTADKICLDDVKNGRKTYNTLLKHNIKPEDKYKNLNIYNCEIEFEYDKCLSDYYVDENNPNKIVLNVKYNIIDDGFKFVLVWRLNEYKFITIKELIFNYYLPKYKKLISDEYMTDNGFEQWIRVMKYAADNNYNVDFYWNIASNVNIIPPEGFDINKEVNNANNLLKTKDNKYIREIIDIKTSKHKGYNVYKITIEK